MPKPWPKLTLCALCAFAWLLGGSSFAQEKADGILFLHLRRDGNGVTLLRADSRPGHLKPQLPNGSLEFEVASGGVILYSGAVVDPLFRPIEFPDAVEPGSLRSEIVPRDSAEFSLRLPANTVGHKLKFFRRSTLEEGKLKTLAARELVGEITIPLAPEHLEALAASAKFHTLLTNGPISARLNIAILAEGFTSDEEITFTNRAHAVLNQFLAVSPYREYRNHFNGFAIFVPSVQSGSDHPATSTYRNTYFNSSYGTGGLIRLITIPPNSFNSNYGDGIGKVNSLLQQFLPEYDIALLLVNDSEYGGSGGFPAIASIHTSSSELALHEIGHSFADLADEYDSPAPGYPEVEKANTTRETRRDFIKWRNWIDESTPIPTPETSTYGNVVGLFEGAYFHATDWYRPKLNCRMNTLGVEFCEVCKETIVLSAYSRLQVIQGSSPSQNNITIPGGGEIVLQVDTVNPVQSSLSYAWTIDGVTNSAFTSNTFPASFATLGLGTRLVRVSVNDPTKIVRTDPLGQLWKTRSWVVDVPSETNQPPVISQIANVTLPATDTSVNVPFTVTDPDTPVERLAITALASNTNLFNESDLHLSGSGTNRSLSLTAHCGRFGVSTITVVVSNGQLFVSNSFTAQITEVDLQVFIAPIPDQRVFAGPISVPFQVYYDRCLDLSFLMHSSNTNLLPNTNFAVEGTGTNRFLRLSPTPGQSGSCTVTLSAIANEIAPSQRSFTITFLAPPMALAAPPQITLNGIYLQFSSNTESTMVLEYSVDFRSWTPVTSINRATSIDHLVPKVALGSAGFYRLRLLPL